MTKIISEILRWVIDAAVECRTRVFSLLVSDHMSERGSGRRGVGWGWMSCIFLELDTVSGTEISPPQIPWTDLLFFFCTQLPR